MPASDTYPPAKYWDDSWNVVYGCTPVGEGCKNCWARALHTQRHKGRYLKGKRSAVYANPFDQVTIFPERIEMPLHWKQPGVVAVAFSSDPYHEDVPDEMLDRVKAVEALCPHLTFIELTKRWERMAEYLSGGVGHRIYRDVVTSWLDDGADGFLGRHWSRVHALAGQNTSGSRIEFTAWNMPLPNVYFGVSVSTQAELDAALSHLLATPAAVRLLSLEPLLEELDVTPYLPIRCCSGEDCGCQGLLVNGPPPYVDGLIIGCESGPNRRPCKIEWVESLVAQAKAAGVPVFVKGVDLDGRVSTNPNEWPESIRCRELPIVK